MKKHPHLRSSRRTAALILAGSIAALLVPRLSAQTTITYTNGQNNTTAYSTSAPNAPTTLSLASGAATQSGKLSGNGGIIKVGAGTLTLSTINNDYTGGTTIREGTLSVSTVGLIGKIGNLGRASTAATDLVFDGGTLRHTGTGASANTNRNFTINAGKTATFDITNAATNSTWTGASIATTGALTKTGAGTLTLAGANMYTGGTHVSAGTLAAGVASVANVSGAFGNNSAVSMANVAGATLDITGFNTQIGSLTGGGATGGNVILGAATLTVGGNNTSPAAYAGVLSGSGGGLTKIGTGTLTLSSANLHSGNTTVRAGTLKLDLSGSISNSAAIIVGDAGSTGTHLDVTTKTGGLSIGLAQTLQGIGQIDGNTTILGTHAPGNSPGLQTFNGNLIYSTSSMVNWELATNSVGTRGTDFDGIDVIGAGVLSIATGVTSNLIFNAPGSAVNFANPFWDSSHSWPVFSNVNSPVLASGAIFDTIIPSLDSLGATLSGGSFSWQQAGNNVSLNYTVSAVPEPATYGALMALGLVGIGTMSVLRRRRNARSAAR